MHGRRNIKLLKLMLRKRWEDVDSIHLAQVNGRWTALCRRWWTSVFCEQRLVCVCVLAFWASLEGRFFRFFISFLVFSFRALSFFPRYFFLIRPVFSLSLPTLSCTSEKSLRCVYFSLEVFFSFLCSRLSSRKKKQSILTEIYCHTPDCHLTPRILGVGGCKGLFLSIRRMRHS